LESPFLSKLAKYNLENLLLHGAANIRQHFNNKQANYKQELILKTFSGYKKGTITNTPWDVNYINYAAVCYTSDFVPNSASTNDYADLINENLGHDELLSEEYLNSLEEQDNFVPLIFWGLARTEFWYQDLSTLFRNFNRQVELLEILPTGSEFDLDSACKNESGFSIRECRELVFVLAAVAQANPDISAVRIDKTFQDRFAVANIDNIKKMIELLSSDYQTIRTSPLAELVFYVYPILRSTRNRYIVCNYFMLFRKIVDGPLWAIKNYFRQQSNGNAFVIYYGELFERYVKKVMDFEKLQGRYVRIPVQPGVKRADWAIESERFRLIVEQKTLVPEISLLARYVRYDQLENHLKKYERAVMQLVATEEDLPSLKKTIKLILQYDTSGVSDGTVKQLLLKKMELSEHFDSLFIIEIGDFEVLMHLLATNDKAFDEVIQEKVDNARGIKNAGFEFGQILAKKKIDFSGSFVQECFHMKTYFGFEQ